MRPRIFTFCNLIHLLLILTAGLLGPVTYITIHSPHQVADRYQIVIFENLDQLHERAVLQHSLQQQFRQNRWQKDYAVIGQPFQLPSLVRDLESVLGLFMPKNLSNNGFVLCLICQPGEYVLIARSTDLPPPDKPPTF